MHQTILWLFSHLTGLALQKSIWGVIGGALLGAASSKYNSDNRNAANSAQTQRQMEFQERMSRNAHRHEVWDLKKAGLNPLLSVNKGASTPSGAAAQQTGPLETTPEAINSALAMRRGQQEIKNMKETEKLTAQQRVKERQAARLLRAQGTLTDAGIAEAVANEKLYMGPTGTAIKGYEKLFGTGGASSALQLMKGRR